MATPDVFRSERDLHEEQVGTFAAWVGAAVGVFPIAPAIFAWAIANPDRIGDPFLGGDPSVGRLLLGLLIGNVVAVMIGAGAAICGWLLCIPLAWIGSHAPRSIRLPFDTEKAIEYFAYAIPTACIVGILLSLNAFTIKQFIESQ